MTTEFVNDPIVPVELEIEGRRLHTLYQPGWYTSGEGSGAFLGRDRQVFGFESLAALREYVTSGREHDLAASPYFADILPWTEADYRSRLCVYELTRLPELVDEELRPEEQATLGSALALLLDLVDYTGIEDEHADALRDDEDVGKLAAGDEVLALFTAGRHRRHVVELLTAHWRPCLAAAAAHVLRKG